MAVMSDLQEEPEESDLADPQQQQLQGELAGEGLAASDPLAGFQLDLSHWEARLKPAPPAPLASQVRACGGGGVCVWTCVCVCVCVAVAASGIVWAGT